MLKNSVDYINTAFERTERIRIFVPTCSYYALIQIVSNQDFITFPTVHLFPKNTDLLICLIHCQRFTVYPKKMHINEHFKFCWGLV